MRHFTILITLALGLSACDTVASGTANTAGFAAKASVKGAYGAGKMAYRGGRWVLVGSPEEEEPEE